VKLCSTAGGRPVARGRRCAEPATVASQLRRRRSATALQDVACPPVAHHLALQKYWVTVSFSALRRWLMCSRWSLCRRSRQACLSLVQSQLEAGTALPEVLRPPLNVEMRLGAVPLIEVNMPNPLDQIQVVPIREDRVVVGGPRRQTLVKWYRSGERHCRWTTDDAGEALVVQHDGKGNAIV